MKKKVSLLVVGVLVCLLAVPVMAVANPWDEALVVRHSHKQQNPYRGTQAVPRQAECPENCPGYVDADGDGVCDNYGTGVGRAFVDADGDGVCDNYGAGNAGCYLDTDGDCVCDNYPGSELGQGTGGAAGSGTAHHGRNGGFGGGHQGGRR